MINPRENVEKLSRFSSCFSPIRNSNTYNNDLEQIPMRSKDGRTNFIAEESRINARGTESENFSSGMETSKLSVFSPVLSSTIMHHNALDKSIRLPLPLGSNVSHPKNVTNSKTSCLTNQDQVIVEEEKPCDVESTPKSTIIEKVYSIRFRYLQN